MTSSECAARAQHLTFLVCPSPQLGGDTLWRGTAVHSESLMAV